MINTAVVFENPGELDVRAIRTFGVSAKESENPIGFFGTGLKYAISILLRTGHQIRVTSGLSVYEFTTMKDSMRGKEFDFVMMNGEALPFTTDLGKTWEVPQAFREIYCNCLDEGGGVALDKPGAPKKGITRVEVSGAEFEKSYYNRDKIVLKMPEHLLIHDGEVKIYDAPSQIIYYRGIAAGSREEPSAYTYNIIAKQDLTEDRTLKSTWDVARAIAMAVGGMTDKKHLRRIICAGEGCTENRINFNFCSAANLSDEFFEVVKEEYLKNNTRLNFTAKNIFKTMKAKDLPKEYSSIELNAVEKKTLSRAIEICTKVFPDFKDFPIVVAASLGEDVHGLAEMEGKTIVLSRHCFQIGTKYLVSTMIEEYMHLTTGFADCSRKMQTHLFDFIAGMIEIYVTGEPI
jgi:hypothetical protein